jgi:hypothetical protein
VATQARPPAPLTGLQWTGALEALKLGAITIGFPMEWWTVGRVRTPIPKRWGLNDLAHYLSEELKWLG